MATFKILNKDNNYKDDMAYKNLIEYIINPEKAKWHNYMCCDINNSYGDMESVAKSFNKNSGIRLRHFIVSFSKYEVRDYVIPNLVAMEVAAFLMKEYQTVYAVHTDTENIHIHFVINAISYIDGHRYRGSKKEFYDLFTHMKKALSIYNIRLYYIK